jgi:enterochelin esterase-like enzyme
MCAVLLLALAVAAPLWAAGTVEEVSFFSAALGMERNALVYLPDGYESSGMEYPVVYLVGGHAATAGNWYSLPDFINALDHLIGDGLVDPFIFVEIDPSCTPWAPDLPYPFPSHLTDSELSGDHETALVADLVPLIDSNYRSIDDPEHRIVFGRSAGGYGAARVALRHPDVFGGLGLQVGLVLLEPVQYMLPMLLTEYPDGPPYSFDPTAGELSFMVFSWSAAFTPNLSNPPWNVDFVLDQDGDLDPEVWDRFAGQSTSRWAAEFAATGAELDIFMDYGDSDFMQVFTTAFADVLDAYGIPCISRSFEGDHDYPEMWQRLQTHITYFFPLNATLELKPRVLNGNHWWPLVEASMELPGDLDVADIDTTTLAITQINGEDLDEPLRALVASDRSDVNGNGRDDLTVWFWKPSLLRLLSDLGIADQEPFDVTVEGETNDLLFLAATDEQRAVHIEAARAMPLWPMTAMTAVD